METELAELLAADDVVHLAAAMDPGSVAGVLIYENLWASLHLPHGSTNWNGLLPGAVLADVGS